MSPRALPARLEAWVVPGGGGPGAVAGGWMAVASLWCRLALAEPVAAADGAEALPLRPEAAGAVARDDPAAAAGQRLLVEGDALAWTVTRVDHGWPGPGRMTLRLERAP